MWLCAHIRMGHWLTGPRPPPVPNLALTCPEHSCVRLEGGTQPPQAAGLSHRGQHGPRTSAQCASRPAPTRARLCRTEAGGCWPSQGAAESARRRRPGRASLAMTLLGTRANENLWPRCLSRILSGKRLLPSMDTSPRPSKAGTGPKSRTGAVSHIFCLSSRIFSWECRHM